MSSKYTPILNPKPKQNYFVKTHLTIDCSLKDLSTEPKPLTKQLKPLKNSKLYLKTQTKKPINEKDKRRKIINKLYGITDQYIEKVNKLKKNNNLSLQEHQAQLLEISTHLQKEQILKLSKNFKTIQQEVSVVHPLPPLNYENLLQHSKLETYKSLQKRKRIPLQQQLIKDTSSPDSAFDLEIKKIKFFKPPKENPNISLLYGILPEHIVKPFAKQY